MTTITIDRAVIEQALEALEAGLDVNPILAGEAEEALRAALAQQDQQAPESTYHPCTFILIKGLKKLKAWDVLAEWDKAREIVDKRLRAAPPQQVKLDDPERRRGGPGCDMTCCQPLAQQAEPLNLRDPAVQKRLATQWGYVPAAQAEPVEPVAWNWMLDGLPYGRAYYGDPPDADIAERAATAGRTVRLLYTALPQRKPLTLEEIHHATGHCGVSKYTAVNITRAVERAHGIKE